MQKKIFYRFNPSTEKYERVYPSKRSRLLRGIIHLLATIAVISAALIALYSWIELPREKELKAENERLRERIEQIDRRLNSALQVMDNLAERDNNFYRVIMHLDPVTASHRYAGLETALMAPLDENYYTDKELLDVVSDRLDILERCIYVQSKSFDEIVQAIGTDKDRLAHTPSIQPISEKEMTRMASGYGYRLDPIYGTSKHHDGMDFTSPIGTPVYATADGTVTSAEWNSGYGNKVDISHGYNYLTRYAHLSEIKVRPGQEVHRGDLIGLVGSTGKSTGPHLHYEVRYKGVPQNPVNYYFGDLTPEEYAAMVQESENAGHVMD